MRHGEDNQRVHVIVLNYNGAPLTVDCVCSLLKSDYPSLRITMVDNHSSDDSVEVLRTAFTDPRVELIVTERTLGYAGGNNCGIRKALEEQAQYILLINSDALVLPHSIPVLCSIMEDRPHIGICTGRCYRSLTKQEDWVCAYERFPSPARVALSRLLSVTGMDVVLGRENVQRAMMGLYYSHGRSTEVAWANGALLFVRREAIEAVGLLDEGFFLTYEDTDWCRRMRHRGWGVYYCHAAEYVHLMSQSRRRQNWKISRHIERQSASRFLRKYDRKTSVLLYQIADFLVLRPLETLRHMLQALRPGQDRLTER